MYRVSIDLFYSCHVDLFIQRFTQDLEHDTDNAAKGDETPMKL
jgi:hypothetical protein